MLIWFLQDQSNPCRSPHSSTLRHKHKKKYEGLLGKGANNKDEAQQVFFVDQRHVIHTTIRESWEQQWQEKLLRNQRAKAAARATQIWRQESAYVKIVWKINNLSILWMDGGEKSAHKAWTQNETQEGEKWKLMDIFSLHIPYHCFSLFRGRIKSQREKWKIKNKCYLLLRLLRLR